MTRTCTCGCCEGVEKLTPQSTANRPGLPALSCRVGTHASFLETMKARLANLCLGTEGDCLNGKGFYPLRALTTRDTADPAIALLDSWAIVADVLAFYQERIANEGFLRTATERRSILELVRLIDYALRPGVAATAHLAYTLDEDRSGPQPKHTATLIPRGSRAQSVPGPGELPQSFETAEDLNARSEWNRLELRMTRPQTEASIRKKGLYLKGLNTRLRPNDALLIDFGDAGKRILPVRVVAVEPDPKADRTHVTLRLWRTVEEAVRAAQTFVALVSDSEFVSQAEKKRATETAADVKKLAGKLPKAKPADQPDIIADVLEAFAKAQADNVTKGFEKLHGLLGTLMTELELTRESLVLSGAEDFQGGPKVSAAQPKRLSDLLPSLQDKFASKPAGRSDLSRGISSSFTSGGSGATDALPRVLGALQPGLEASLYQAWGNAYAQAPAGIRVYAFRIAAPVFGYNAQPKPLKFNSEDGSITVSGDWPIIEGKAADGAIQTIFHEEETVINLDASYEQILPRSWVLVETAETKLTKAGLLITQSQAVNATIGRSKYGLSGKTTRIVLGASNGVAAAKTWIQLAGKAPAATDFDAIRRSTVYAQSEELELVEEPIETPIGACQNLPASAAVELELGRIYDGLDAGRWLILSGERVMEGTNEVTSSELVMLAQVQHRSVPDLPGDKSHTFLTLAGEGLAHCYKRDTVTIYGNVVKATHGETVTEPANGTGKAFQQFTLKRPPLTFVSAANPSGVESSLQLRSNDVLWYETSTLAGLLPTDRKFITRTDDNGNTTVIAGDGWRGARWPSGLENVKATYRSGIGKAGNVKAQQISLLMSRPLNVKEVSNPLPASGGADRENRDSARANAPLAVMALDRLVSVQDYADFARTFAGIGKASASRLSDGRRQLVHVTIAGVDDIPIAKTSDLFRNLGKALLAFGDRRLPVQIDNRVLRLLVLEARVGVLPEYLWEKVEFRLRAALLDTFSFQRRDLAQDALLSEVFTSMQAVEGVAYVDVDVFDTIDEEKAVAALSKSNPESLALSRKERVKVDLARVVLPTDSASPRIEAAALAFFNPNIPDTLILNEVKR